MKDLIQKQFERENFGLKFYNDKFIVVDDPISMSFRWWNSLSDARAECLGIPSSELTQGTVVQLCCPQPVRRYLLEKLAESAEIPVSRHREECVLRNEVKEHDASLLHSYLWDALIEAGLIEDLAIL